MRPLQFLFVAAAVAIGISAPIPVASAQDRVVPSERVRNFVYIRENASSESSEIGRLKPNESVEFVRNVPRWREVRLPDDRTGFVSKSWTRVISAGAAAIADQLSIHFLSIGAGTCTVIECPGANAPPMLVDCGSTGGSRRSMAHNKSETKSEVQSILARHQPAPNVVLTHGHTDHYKWIPDILEGVTAQHIWRGGRNSSYSDTFNDWVETQDRQGAVIHERLEKNLHNDGEPLGDDLSCGMASTYVLTVNTGSNTSSRSLMVMIEYGSFTAIFPGDAQKVTQDNAIRNFSDGLQTTVLSASHHGARSAGSNNDDWVEATSPNVVNYSSGKPHGHPTCTAVERYRDHGSLASVSAHPTQCDSRGSVSNSNLAEYVTDMVGNIVITTTGSSPLSLTCEASQGCNVEIAY